MNVVERIRQSHDSLTTTEQEAADFILGHLTDALISNSAELSQLSGVSQPTLSRLFRKLGYKNAREFRRDVRRYHQPGAPEVASPDSTSGNFAHDLLERDTTSLSRTYNRISDGQIATLAARILDARTVAILGLRNNYPMALHLREQLVQSRSNVMMLPQPGQSLAEEIVDLDGRDLAILFGVRRRTPIFATIAQELHRQGVPIIMVGDSTLRRTAQSCDATFLEADVSVHILTSFTAAFSLVALLADAVATRAQLTGHGEVGRVAGLGEIEKLEGVEGIGEIGDELPAESIEQAGETGDAAAVEGRIERINRGFAQLDELERGALRR
ncbi:MAG: MurR/RpiR family transcriptional regulator [Bifidobacterium tibiigranuli]|uniref:MurR/RpiR family transcriptional regulator n=1 Tax=Bifidobacterium tibiigranuli TaxID=2172043 RepID=UPI0026EA78B0|nr:MurR/RpiR family transcriptional regulator [Bifidobacterium tibiigranuli]MCI1674613.1 MurR/RpiR family transcriptional regulator [Bifidobacterium tibiigranuli]MCI1714165.1 MurR/RpiR family transcriptional regulator [Bifidobacterium tibiigranuli]MCI1834126.1 MurR/RpiR family transcriptional regulator [Bifidobacterium tibiigranuli]